MRGCAYWEVDPDLGCDGPVRPFLVLRAVSTPSRFKRLCAHHQRAIQDLGLFLEELEEERACVTEVMLG